MNKTNQTLLTIVLMFVMFLLALKTFEEVKMLTSPKAEQEDEAITEAEQKTERTWECAVNTLWNFQNTSIEFENTDNYITRGKYKELRFPYFGKDSPNPWILWCGK